jgi:hypothetical protein
MNLTLIFAFFAVAILTIAPAIYSGQRGFRWGADKEVQHLAANVAAFPSEIDGWHSIADIEMEKYSKQLLNPIAYISRRYQKSDRFAQVFVLLGPTGPTAVHSPDICFSSVAYEKLADRQAVPLENDASCWRIRFKDRKSVDGAPFLTSWYGWTSDETLLASNSPRYEFSGRRVLLKIQITSQYLDRDAMFDDAEMESFVQEIAKEVETIMQGTNELQVAEKSSL